MSMAYIITKHDDPAIDSLSITRNEIEDMCFGKMCYRNAIWHYGMEPYGRHITLGDEAIEYFRALCCYHDEKGRLKLIKTKDL